jgi:hypothetical protein
LTFNHCNKKRCAVLFGDLKDINKYKIHKKLEQTMVDAPESIKDMVKIKESKDLLEKFDPENEKYVYKLLEHLDPTVA